MKASWETARNEYFTGKVVAGQDRAGRRRRSARRPRPRRGRHRGDHELHEHVEPGRHARRRACSRGRPRRAGSRVKPWVKTSLAPGSKVVTRYLQASGTMADLEKLGFNLVGYGCTTCIGNSGPLPEPISEGDRAGRPRRRGGALRQPQLRGPRESADARELPRVAAARRRVRDRRHRRLGSGDGADRHRRRGQAGLLPRRVAVERRDRDRARRP